MDYLDIYIEDTLSTRQIDYYTYNALQSLDLVAPPYSRIALANVQNTYHEQCLIYWSNVVKGYRFVDEDKAGKVPDFLKNNVFNQFDIDISFQEMLETQFFNYAIYQEFFDQIARFGKDKEIKKIYPLSPKYLYPDRKKKEYWQIIPNSDEAKMFFLEPDSEESNIDYTKDNTRFVRFGLSNGKNQEVYAFSGKSSRSDYFPNIPYLEALKSIETNSLIGTYDKNWLKSGSNFKNILILNGIDTEDARGQEIIEKYKKDFNSNASRAGSTYVLPINSGHQSNPVELMSPNNPPKEDFNSTRDVNRDEILAAHNLNPTIMGIKTNESSLTSTSVNESLKLFIETSLVNPKKLIELHYDKLFKAIDPTYNTEFKLEIIEVEDESATAEIEIKIADNTLKYLQIGNLELFNEFRVESGRREYEEDEFNKAVAEYNKNVLGGVSFGVDNAE